MRTLPFAAPLRRWLDVIVVLACVAVALGFTWFHGTDLNWDLQNYHVYSALGFVQGRLPSEYMAAGLMSYLNPLPMLPFYGMLAAGWRSLAIGMVLGLTHAANLVLLWLICRRLFGQLDLASPLALMALLIGAASPLFLVEIGTSFADITTCIPVLGGVLLLLGAQTRGRLLVAGVLLGAAAGMKLTNVPFAVAAAAFVFVPGTSWRQLGASLGWLVLGGLIGGVLTGGYWAWLLYREFHNPIFPFANALFRSPDFPATSHIHRRFLTTSLQEALAFPFYMAIPKLGLYSDVSAPDLRFAFWTLGAAAGMVLFVFRKKVHRPFIEPGDRSWLRFLGYMVISWALWLVQFANGRYFLPLSLLIGPALIVVLVAVMSVKRALLVAFVCAFLQIGHMQANGLMSFGETRTWPDHYINLDMPRKLVERRYLYLSMDILSDSYLAAFVHPQSRFLNVDGMVPLDLDGPGGERVQRELARFAGATRMLVQISTTLPAALASSSFVPALDADLNRFGLRVDTADCVSIVNLDVHLRLARLAPDVKGDAKLTPSETVFSCGLIPTPPDPALQASRTQAALLFDKIEQTCPHQFPARWNGVVMRSKDNLVWSRYYVDTDLFLHVGAKNVYAEHGKFVLASLGTQTGLMNGTERVPCERIRWHAPPTPSLDLTH